MLRVNKVLLTEREEQKPDVEERLIVSKRYDEERWYQDLDPLEKYQPKWVHGEMDIICVGESLLIPRSLINMRQALKVS